MPTLKQLHSFIAVADSGSFSKAAEKLFVTSTALILQLNHLEDELGFKLFSRNSQGISLTEAGSFYLQEVKEVERKLNNATMIGRRIANRQSEIKVGYVSWSLPSVLLELSAKVKQQNNMTIAMIFTDINLALNHVHNHILDCCIMPASRQVRASGLRFMPLKAIPLYIGARPDIIDVKKKTLLLEDLEGHAIVLPEYGLFDSTDGIRDYIESHHLSIEVISISDNMEAELYCAEHNACRISATFQMGSPLLYYPLGNDIPYMFCLVYLAESEKLVEPLFL